MLRSERASLDSRAHLIGQDLETVWLKRSVKKL